MGVIEEIVELINKHKCSTVEVIGICEILKADALKQSMELKDD